MKRDAHPTGDINDRLPFIPHKRLGVDCCGCLFVVVWRDHADIRCNECDALIRTVPVADVEKAMTELAQTDAICSACCTYCGALNTFPGFSAIQAFTCSECGEGVRVVTPPQ
jgi:hypothetical protein